MRLYSTLKMNKPIDNDKILISPGGYEMTFGGRDMQFDFEYSGGNIDDDDKSIIHFEQRKLDISSFPDAKALDNIDFLQTLEKIKDFYVDIEGPDDLNLESIISVSFETTNYDRYDVPDDILAECNDIIAEYNETIA